MTLEAIEQMPSADIQAAWRQFVAKLPLFVERVETTRADLLSPNARSRNGYRSTPGVRVEWTVVLKDPSETLQWIVKWETPSGPHKTKRAAHEALPEVRKQIEAYLTGKVEWIDLARDNDDLPRRVLEQREEQA